MFKIWGKVVEDGKIVKQVVYQREDKFTYSLFFNYLADICESLDIATPVLLKTHLFNFAKFNTVRFLPRDFAETVGFDFLSLEKILA